MKAYLFISAANARLTAMTSDRTGRSLPASRGPWRVAGAHASLYISHDDDFIAQAIQRDGYYLLVPELST